MFPVVGLLLKAWRLPANEKTSLCAELEHYHPDFPGGLPRIPAHELNFMLQQVSRLFIPMSCLNINTWWFKGFPVPRGIPLVTDNDELK